MAGVECAWLRNLFVAVGVCVSVREFVGQANPSVSGRIKCGRFRSCEATGQRLSKSKVRAREAQFEKSESMGRTSAYIWIQDYLLYELLFW